MNEFYQRIEKIEAILRNFELKKHRRDNKFRMELRRTTIEELTRYTSKELAAAIIHYLISR